MITETQWRKQWSSRLMQILQRVKKLQTKLEDKNQTAIAFFVDPANLKKIEQLADRFERVHVVTEQSIVVEDPNVIVWRLPDSFYGIYYRTATETEHVIKKEFNCFLNRNDVIRQSWFYLLHIRGLLDKGYVSFNLNLCPDALYPSNCPEKMFEYYHKTYLSSFDYAYDDIKKLIPFKNFVDNDNLGDIILETKFSIICETHVERTDCQVFSEKTWRTIQLSRPWLLFAATDCVKKLRNMGFDVFDDYVDHAYDDYDTSLKCVQRQEKILEEAERLMQIKITPGILHDWNKKAKRNQNIMKKWSQNYQKQVNSILQQIDNHVHTH